MKSSASLLIGSISWLLIWLGSEGSPNAQTELLLCGMCLIGMFVCEAIENKSKPL